MWKIENVFQIDVPKKLKPKKNNINFELPIICQILFYYTHFFLINLILQQQNLWNKKYKTPIFFLAGLSLPLYFRHAQTKWCFRKKQVIRGKIEYFMYILILLLRGVIFCTNVFSDGGKHRVFMSYPFFGFGFKKKIFWVCLFILYTIHIEYTYTRDIVRFLNFSARLPHKRCLEVSH